MVIHWTAFAKASLHDIFVYTEGLFGRQVATKVVRQVYNEVSYLTLFPRLGVFERRVGDVDYRAIVSKRHKVFYSIDGDVIKIHLVWDTRRDPETLTALLTSSLTTS